MWKPITAQTSTHRKANDVHQFKNVFLLYGTIFGVGWVVMDAVRGRPLNDWWLDLLSGYVCSGIAALIGYKFSKWRAARNRERG